MSPLARPFSKVLAVTVAALALLAAGSAAAQSTVVLLRGVGDDPLARQAETLLIAELRAAGFVVDAVDRTPGMNVRDEIEATTAARQPVATLAIVPARGGAAAEVWLADRVTGKLVIRAVHAGRRSGRGAAADLALRAVELLRGSLLEVTAERPHAEALPEPPPEVARFIESTSRTPPPRVHFLDGWGLTLAATVLHTPGGFGPSYAPALRLSRAWSGGFGVRVTLLAPGITHEVDASDGTAFVRQDVALVEAVYVLRAGARLQPFFSAGAGGQHVRASGQGSSPAHRAADGRAFASAFAVGAGLALRLGEAAAVVVEGSAVALAPRTRIVVGRGEAGHLGVASIAASVGVVTLF